METGTNTTVLVHECDTERVQYEYNTVAVQSEGPDTVLVQAVQYSTEDENGGAGISAAGYHRHLYSCKRAEQSCTSTELCSTEVRVQGTPTD